MASAQHCARAQYCALTSGSIEQGCGLSRIYAGAGFMNGVEDPEAAGRAGHSVRHVADL